MAKMIPSRPVEGAPSSERKVFDYLRDGLPAECIVLHGHRFARPATPHRRVVEGETDFLVIHPHRGLLAIEVKGGEVGRTAEGWYSVDRDGQRHAIQDPGRQVQDAIHHIGRSIRKSSAFRGFRVPFGWGAVFPDVTVKKDLEPALPRQFVIDRGDLADIRSAIDRVFDGYEPLSASLPRALIDVLVETLAPTFHLVPSLADRIAEDESIMVRLTEEQMQVLDILADSRRVGVQGVAGTGKTLVAMEKSRRMAEEGKRVRFLCYNRPLAEFLSKRAHDFPVTTFHQLCRDLAEAAGLEFKVPDPSNNAAFRGFWEETAAQILLDALDRRPTERCDAVVVDEGQDFKEFWWLGVEKILRNPEQGTLYVFYDPNQAIYGGWPSTSLQLSPAKLIFNCRNTLRIAEYCSKIVSIPPKVKEGTAQSVEVVERQCKSEREMVDAVRKLLHGFTMDQKISPERIAILTTHGIRKSPVWKARRLGNIELVELGRRDGPNQTEFSTLHRFKGLEADVVVVCDVDRGKWIDPKQLYVAASRARHVLAVVDYAA